MDKWPNLFWSQEKSYKQLVTDNYKAINEYNEKMIAVLSLMGWVLMLLSLIATPFSIKMTGIVPVYLLAFAIYLALFFLFRLPKMRKHSILGLYIIFSVLFMLAIYLSTIYTPNMRATILLGVFCIMPLSFIDRPGRMNLFAAFWLIVHTTLAFYLKPQYALDDAFNCLCFAILGCFLGNMVIQVRLEGYEARRQLTLEKEIDVLTGLYNRRKLFETLAHLETADAEKPSAILMLDIDNFKEFNDSHGHVAGDRCLGCFGETLMKFAQSFRLQFYRYGGEEFVALAYGYSEKEMLVLAESLRIAMQNTDVDGHRITVSIGAAYCDEEQIRNYEKVIVRADEAAYAAKRAGRNRVCTEQKDVQVQ
jgi:diguanylate cyclase (GGDEF)-like protein